MDANVLDGLKAVKDCQLKKRENEKIKIFKNQQMLHTSYLQTYIKDIYISTNCHVKYKQKDDFSLTNILKILIAKDLISIHIILYFQVSLCQFHVGDLVTVISNSSQWQG